MCPFLSLYATFSTFVVYLTEYSVHNSHWQCAAREIVMRQNRRWRWIKWRRMGSGSCGCWVPETDGKKHLCRAANACLNSEFRSLSLYCLNVHILLAHHRSQQLSVVCAHARYAHLHFCFPSRVVWFVRSGHFLSHNFVDFNDNLKIQAGAHTHTHTLTGLDKKVHDEWETKAWTRSQHKRWCVISFKNCSNGRNVGRTKTKLQMSRFFSKILLIGFIGTHDHLGLTFCARYVGTIVCVMCVCVCAGRSHVKKLSFKMHGRHGVRVRVRSHTAKTAK